MKAMLWLARLLLFATPLIPVLNYGAQEGVKKEQSQERSAQKSPSKELPSPQEIAEAKAKGLVWVNTATRVYHKDGPTYGKTSHGRFMAEEDAKKAGFRIASKAGAAKARAEAGT